MALRWLDFSMLEEFELEALFTSSLEEEREHYGRLYFEPQQGAHVELAGFFLEAGETGFPLEGYDAKRVGSYWAVSNRLEYVWIPEATEVPRGWASPGFAYGQLKDFTSFYVGRNIIPTSNVLWEQCCFKLTGLQDWLDYPHTSKSESEYVDGISCLKVTYNNPKDGMFKTDFGEFTLEFNFPYGHGSGQMGVRIEPDTLVLTKPTNTQPCDWYLRLLRDLRIAWSLLMWNIAYYEDVVFENPSEFQPDKLIRPSAQWFTSQPNLRNRNYVPHYQMMLSGVSNGPIAMQLLVELFRQRAVLMPVAELLVSTLSGSFLTGSYYYLALAQCLETMYRGMNSNEQIFTKKLEWLASQLGKNTLTTWLPDLSSSIPKMKSLRNAFAHNDRAVIDALTPADMFNYLRELKLFTLAVLLNCLKIDDAQSCQCLKHVHGRLVYKGFKEHLML